MVSLVLCMVLRFALCLVLYLFGAVGVGVASWVRIENLLTAALEFTKRTRPSAMKVGLNQDLSCFFHHSQQVIHICVYIQKSKLAQQHTDGNASSLRSSTPRSSRKLALRESYSWT